MSNYKVSEKAISYLEEENIRYDVEVRQEYHEGDCFVKYVYANFNNEDNIKGSDYFKYIKYLEKNNSHFFEYFELLNCKIIVLIDYN